MTHLLTMDKNIIIKFDIKGDFQEDAYYKLLLDYSKVSNIISLENVNSDCDTFLREQDGREILMQYKGISRIDKKSIFVLNTSLVLRDYIISKLGL